MPTTFYTEQDVQDLRQRIAQHEQFLEAIGARRVAASDRWFFDMATHPDVQRLKGQRDAAEAALLRAGWRKAGATVDQDGSWEPATPAALAADAARRTADAFNAARPVSVADQAEMARPVDPGPGRLTIELPVWERRAEAERLLLEMGWTITTDRQSYTPPVCWLPPTLVHVLEKVAAADSDACLGYTLTPGDVRYIAMGVGAIRSARPNKVFEHVAWLRSDLVGALRDLSTQNTPWATVAQTETIRRAVALFDLLEAAGDRAAPPAELRVDTSDIPEAGADWFARAEWREGREHDAFSTDRAADLPTPAKINARTIPFPVLDAIALLAAIDTRAAPFAGGTRAAEAVGELEQGVESWLDRRAGGK